MGDLWQCYLRVFLALFFWLFREKWMAKTNKSMVPVRKVHGKQSNELVKFHRDLTRPISPKR